MIVGLLMALTMLASGPLYEAFGGNAFAIMAILPVVALAILAVYRSRAGTGDRP